MAALPCRLQLGTFLIIFSSLVLLVPASSFEMERPQRPRRALLGAPPQSTVQQYLAPHNKLRAGLGLPPLQWSDTVANFAAWWASQRKGDCALLHSDSNYGENIFWGSGGNWQPGNAKESGDAREVRLRVLDLSSMAPFFANLELCPLGDYVVNYGALSISLWLWVKI
ncbi:hypothetical protein Taro_015418 [Colocasia esculenta]|uniref:SCP domain-containing protein n=1 Tax=Colocasia esculenta TaxID=4460 RepID=A0A843UHR1_COLES|nr:hypothetical protein [Colocasia esculenta]